jgi:hypothetical protein
MCICNLNNISLLMHFFLKLKNLSYFQKQVLIKNIENHVYIFYLQLNVKKSN